VINPHARSALTPTADLPFELNCITTSGGIYERETGFLSVFFLSLILACGFSLPASASYTMTVSPSSASVPVGDTQQFIAVSDPTGPISWSFVITYWTGCPRPHCVRHVTSCSGCGTVSPTSTQSGAPTTYTAPSIPYHFPSGAQAPELAVVASRGYLSAMAVITIPPIQVSASPNPVTVPLSMTQQVTATVANDGTNQGVTWSVQQNGVPCSPACGTISPTKTLSGAPATYTAPSTSPVLPVVSLVATSVDDPTKSGSSTQILTTAGGRLICSAGSGREAMLKGQYAFLLQPFDPQWGGLSVVGSLTADGTGKITGLAEDIGYNSGAGRIPPTINTTGSLYVVGPDHRGCLVLTDTNGEAEFFFFALGSINSSGIATAGRVNEVNDTIRIGTRATGTIRLQDPSSFIASQLKGSYAFGVVGRTPKIPGTAVIGSLALARNLAFDGISAITSGNFDANLGGAAGSNVSTSGSFTCCSANGRGIGQFSSTTTPTSIGFALYMVNSDEAFLLLNNDQWGAAGEAIRIPSGTSFTQSSLDGVAVLRETAQSSSGPMVDIATAHYNGTGALTVNSHVNSAGTFTTSSTALNYLVAPNGRVTIVGGTAPPVLYLFGKNQGFLVGTDADVTFGFIEPQATGPFGNASFSGAYMLGTENPSASTVTLESGVATADGKESATGTSDQSSSAGLAPNQGLNLSYSVSANGTGSVGSGTTAILISDNKLVFISNTSANPTITVAEK